ncbi:fructose 1,6-bisphosphatase [Chelatococcus sp. SYSU_G07232]|uniref:Fructose-1,6-bisphosphate aldolase/phosphatase n=1 Tax=Chelatococcus albus TaxID=3047466 RepID=A0ABT7AFT3_9HYPH|nr:fructose 1,6-bisphosphatase [Chelatococcus sp. SYSU_G07232]MDJ1157867.1 fructose 1,6-bisphosphatase [Chelatococcus sp. SYSU_G07232]
MRITLSVIKADVGSIGGHTKPSERMLACARSEVAEAQERDLLIDGFVAHTGDDIALIMSHRRGKGHPEIHRFAWNTFMKATQIAREDGLYGAGQDLLVDAPSGNLRGAGPAVAEIEFDHTLAGHRPAESFMVLAADKCGPGAYNLPLYLAFADPMYCAGLMLPQMIKGFRFRIIDMDNTKGDSILELDAPEDAYHIAALLRDNERFGIDAIISRTHGEQAVAVSAQRLHAIAGKYTGKDDPVALVRNQGIFPAPEELLSPFAKAHYVGGDARGSHVMPLMPVPLNTAVTGMYCLPIVSCTGFSLDRAGRFSSGYTDFFGNPAWDEVRRRAQQKAIEMRSQGWSGAAMLPYAELEYSGFRETVGKLVERFKMRKDAAA